jgi:hypothetical protein
MRYEEVARVLPGLADGDIAPEPEIQHYIDHSLRAQAELARYRRMLRSLAALRDEQLVPTVGLLDDILDALDHPGLRTTRSRTGRRLAVAGAIGGAAVAVGGTVAAVLVARSRKRPLLAS